MCIMVFDPRPSGASTGTISLTASGDNRSNGFSLDRFASTKFPLGLILMELSHQLRTRQVELDIAWRPREENIEADALTNHDYSAFTPARRVPVVWSDLRFGVLRDLLGKAEDFYDELKAIKKVEKGKYRAVAGKAKKQRLRESDPW